MLMDKVSICLTSCGRWDLLNNTISSLMNRWDGECPDAFYIHDDSGQADIKSLKILDNLIKYQFGINAQWSFSSRQGQVYAIDQLYSQVKTEFIFHCEDDWEFVNSGFVADSIAILKHDPLVANVWLRFPDDRNGHPAMNKVNRTPEGLKYQYMSYEYKGIWHGLTWNPGMRRLSDYLSLGKFNNFCRWSFQNQITAEMDFNKTYRNAGLRGATLINGYIRHTGGNQSIKTIRQ